MQQSQKLSLWGGASHGKSDRMGLLQIMQQALKTFPHGEGGAQSETDEGCNGREWQVKRPVFQYFCINKTLLNRTENLLT